MATEVNMIQIPQGLVSPPTQVHDLSWLIFLFALAFWFFFRQAQWHARNPLDKEHEDR